MHSETWLVSGHPVCANKGASQHFLGRAATPLCKEGNTPALTFLQFIHSFFAVPLFRGERGTIILWLIPTVPTPITCPVISSSMIPASIVIYAGRLLLLCSRRNPI